MSAKTDVIAAIYHQVAAPSWAARNLDALADVLRDLSWLPEQPVQLVLPSLDRLARSDREALLAVLARAVTESIGAPRPVRIRGVDVDR